MDQDVSPGQFRYSNFAVELGSGRLLTLHGADDETVEAMKVRCRALEVRCPVERCLSPELSATVGYVRADGTPVTAYFSHKSGGGDGGHGPESYAIARIKHAVRDWAVGLGHPSEVDALLPGTDERTDVLVDGPAPFAVELARNGMTAGDWADRTSAAADADRDPLWLWLSPGASCPTSFRISWVVGEYEELHDIWFAGIDGDGNVRVAMASGYPRFSYEANAEIGGEDIPGLCRPLWRDLSEIGLNGRGFVDQALLDMANAIVEGGNWTYNNRTGRIEEFLGRPRTAERTLFDHSVEPNDVDRSGWSPEELANPGTRWFRDILHDRRHQAFLDGLDDLCAYDWGASVADDTG